MSIPREYYVDSSKTKFRRVSTSFHVLFQCNFADRKIHGVSTYFFRFNLDGWKIHVVSTNFFRCNFSGQKIHVVFTDFIPCNFDGRKKQMDEISTLFLVKLQANENNRRSFPLLVTLKNWLLQDFSLNFSSKSHSCSPSRTIFESCNLKHYKRELPHISFLGIYRTITLYNFWVVTLLWSHSCKKVQ